MAELGGILSVPPEDIQESLTEIVERVLQLQHSYTKDNTSEMQERGLLVRSHGPTRIRELLPPTVDLDPADLAVEGRDGTGLKTRVPWMRVFSSSRSPAATRGWYVVYLFAFDGSSVFLSLNQGTTTPTGKVFKERPEDFLEKRVQWAKKLIEPASVDVSQDELHLADPTGLGSGYEKGNVTARRYSAGAIPNEEVLRSDLWVFVDRLAALYRAEEDPELSKGLPSYEDDPGPKSQEGTPDLKDVASFIAWMRKTYGPELVPTRQDAEQDARDLLNEHAGSMTKDQALGLLRLFNKGVYGSVMRSNRFSPAFVGASSEKLVEPINEFNEWTEQLWTGSEPEVLAAVDRILKDPSVLPGSGRSFVTMLMYLRDPSKYCVWLRMTQAGLSALDGFAESNSRQGGVDRYLRFCAAAQEFANRYSLEAQELDAIFAEAARAAVGKSVGPLLAGKNETGATPSLLTVSKKTYLPIEQLEEWEQLLRGPKRQALFYGPPGTGKTFLAKNLASYLVGDKGLLGKAQFHPSYSYEDFIEGLRPVVTKSDTMTYQVRPGAFRRFCDKVRDLPGQHVFIIDEINRAEMGAVLGELMLLLEYRTEEVELPYSQEMFSIPSNLIVLATMNTADRSLALVDFALRRRFHAFELLPSREVLQLWSAGRGDGADLVLKFFDLVQEAVVDSSYAPGQSYWMIKELTAPELLKVWKYELYPYLAEYWFEHKSRLVQLDLQVRELLAEEA